MIPNRRQNIQNLALILRGVPNAICRNNRESQAACNTYRCLIPLLPCATSVALQFDVDVVPSEDADQLFDTLTPSRLTTCSQSRGKRSFLTPGKAKQSIIKLPQIIQRGCALTLCLL